MKRRFSYSETNSVNKIQEVLDGYVRLSDAYSKRIIFTNYNTRMKMIKGVWILIILLISMHLFIPQLMRTSTTSLVTVVALSIIHSVQLKTISAEKSISIPKEKVNQKRKKKNLASSVEQIDSVEELTESISIPADIEKESKQELTQEEQIENSTLFIDPLDIFMKSPDDIKNSGMSVGEYYNKVTEYELKRILNKRRKL